MGECRYLITQCMIEIDLARCVVQMIIAANDVGDTHIAVIDDNHEVVSGCAIGSGDDQIVEFSVIEFDRALGHVAKDSEVEGVQLHLRLSRLDRAFNIGVAGGEDGGAGDGGSGYTKKCGACEFHNLAP